MVKCNKDIALYNDRCLVPVRAEEPPKVSVIIPVYNTEKYLAETLNSVARQSLKELEIICLDDGSTDNSLQYLLAFAAKEKRCAVIQQSNGGLSRARNVALKYARGEYVYFLDSDDLLKDEALHNAYNLAKADSLDFVVFSGEVFFETDALKDAHQGEIKLFALKNSYPGIYMGQNLYCQLVKNHDYNVSVCLKLIARQFLVDKKLEFLEGCIHEDNLFSQQLFLLAERAAILPEALFLRRVREQSIVTIKNPYKHFDCSFRIYFEMVKFTYSLKLNPQSQDIIQAKLDNFFRNTVKKAFLTLDEKEQKIPALLSASLMDRALFDALGNNLLLEAARAEQNKSLLKLVEKKDKLAAYKAQAQARMERLEQAKARLQEKSEKLLNKKAALQARCERLEQERASLKESCNKAKAEVQLLAQELELLKDSAAFKLGKLMNLGKRFL